MSLIFNGTNIETIIYNGIAIDKLIYNGVIVYESFPGETILYYNNNTSSVMAERVRINKNDTTPTYIYCNDVLVQTLTESGDITSKTFTIEVGENVVRIVGGSFYAQYAILLNGTKMYKAVLGRNFIGPLIGGLSGLNNLTELVVGPYVTEIDNIPTAVSSLTLSEGLEKVLQECFYNNTGLEDISIPSTVGTIERNAFKSCSAKTITINSTNCQFGLNLFESSISLKDVYIIILQNRQLRLQVVVVEAGVKHVYLSLLYIFQYQ